MDSPKENENKSSVLRGCWALEKMRLIKRVSLVNAAIDKGEVEPVRPVSITILSEYKHTHGHFWTSRLQPLSLFQDLGLDTAVGLLFVSGQEYWRSPRCTPSASLASRAAPRTDQNSLRPATSAGSPFNISASSPQPPAVPCNTPQN